MSISRLIRKAAAAYGLEATDPIEDWMHHSTMDVLKNGTTIGRIAFVDGRDSKKYSYTVERGMLTYISLADKLIEDSVPVCFLHGFPTNDKITYIMGDDLRMKVKRWSVNIFGNNYEYSGFENKPYTLGTMRRIMRTFQEPRLKDEWR